MFSEELFTCVDVEYAVNDYMKSHTGGTMYFEYGTLHYQSYKKTEHE